MSERVVDRTYPLHLAGFGIENRERIHVVKARIGGRWGVWRGIEKLRDFDTHAEAIRWAQARAALDKYPDAPRYHLTHPEPMEAP